MDVSSDSDWNSLLEDVSAESSPKAELLRKKLDYVEELPKKKSYKTRIINYNLCPNCQTECQSNEGTIHCPNCGHLRELMRETTHYSASVNQTHNTAVNAFMSFKMVGKNSYSKQRNLIKTCSNSAVYARNNNKKEIHNYNYQFSGNKFPKDALEKAHEIICQIRKAGYVYRGKGRKGMWGACISVSCQANRTTKARKAICALLDIEERFLSQGDRKLAELEENGIITLPRSSETGASNKYSLEDYIVQYFSALNIPMKYKLFIVDLIERAEKKRFHMKNDSRLTTKCVGAIYMLTMRVRSLNHITKDVIWKESNISKSTFTRYYRLLFDNHKKIKKVFKKHRIPMDVSWRTED